MGSIDLSREGNGGDRLQIERFHVNYLVSRDTSASDRMKEQLGGGVLADLTETLAHTLSRMHPIADPSVWCIRRLELDFSVNLAWSHDRVAHVWADQIVDQLDVAMEDGAEDVLRFDNWAAYLAAFLLDLARGTAWGKWYYRRFEGLRLLPLSVALATAIREEPAVGHAALLRLPAQDSILVVRTLTLQHAESVLLALAGDGSAVNDLRCFRAVWAVWSSEWVSLDTVRDEARDVLALYLSSCRANPNLSRPTLLAATRSIMRLAALLDRSPAIGLRAFSILLSGEPAALWAAMDLGDAEVLAPLARCSREWLESVGDALMNRRVRNTNGSAIEDRRYTAFGGLFLLLPILDSSPLTSAVTGWPDAQDTTAIALVRFLTFVSCCGPERAARVFSNPLVRDLFGMGSAVTVASIATWQDVISVAHVEDFARELSASQQYDNASSTLDVTDDTEYFSLHTSLHVSPPFNRAITLAARILCRSLAWRIPGFSSSSAPFLYSNFLDMPASLEDEETRRVVRLGRPPLAVLLAMNGMTRSTYRVSWLDERPFTLFAQE